MSTIINTSFIEKAQTPYLQGGIVLILVFAIMLLAKITKWTGLLSVSDVFPWTVACSFMLFFALFNCVISLASKDIDKYWKQSILVFVALAGVSGILAYLFSSLTLGEAGGYQWIYIVFTFGYLVFISIIGFMKRIVDFAEGEEWSKPKRRK